MESITTISSTSSLIHIGSRVPQNLLRRTAQSFSSQLWKRFSFTKFSTQYMSVYCSLAIGRSHLGCCCYSINHHRQKKGVEIRQEPSPPPGGRAESTNRTLETLNKENDQDNANKPIIPLSIQINTCNGAADMDMIEDDSNLFLFTENLKLVILFLILVFFMLMMSYMMGVIELVVGDRDKEETRTILKEMMSMRSSRRHVLEDIEIKDDKIEEEARRVSLCIPSKNALILMWCRSDRMKMAALANRFSWDANAASKQEDANEGGENINKGIEDIEEQLHVQECEVVDEVDDEISQQNVGVSIEQEIPAEAKSKSEVPQNDLLL